MGGIKKVGQMALKPVMGIWDKIINFEYLDSSFKSLKDLPIPMWCKTSIRSTTSHLYFLRFHQVHK